MRWEYSYYELLEVLILFFTLILICIQNKLLILVWVDKLKCIGQNFGLTWKYAVKKSESKIFYI